MDKQQLQQTLNQPFNTDRWKEVLETVFPGSQYWEQERAIDSKEEMVERIADKGTIRLSDGKNLALVELTLKPGSVHLHRNRVKLRSLIAKLIDQERAYGVIAVFEQGGGDYRLSFVAKEAVIEDGEFKNRETPAKRFTYLLGPGETCRTAAERLFSLSQKQELTLDDVTDAFSVEKLNKEFYRHIQKYFYELAGAKTDRAEIKGCMTLPSKPIEEQENHKAYSEFAVRLLGRVVFCWFLKHKRCDQNRPLIPEELLSSQAVEAHGGYYHSVLEKLFFQTLNKPMNERSKYAPEFAHLIPYLNGGLFDPHHDDFYEEGALGESKAINTLLIPDDWFLNLFQTLEMYNFTIDENTALDADVSIDPEILGRIFENLLAEINPETGDSARKATGSFYTPREIVDYMVEESLLQHLKTALGIESSVAAGADCGSEDRDGSPSRPQGGAGSPSTPSESAPSPRTAGVSPALTESAPSPIRDDSCKFVGNHDLEQNLRALFVDDDNPHNLDDKTRRAVVDAFRTIKVLDPACGSGAFPVGILQKMLCALRKVDEDNDHWLDAQIAQIHEMKLSKQEESRRLDEIEHAFKTNEADYGRKLGIIQNSVYGVDIQPIAIEISKLRFFLTLVVDEKINEKEDNRGILPLPNLDFKFVCANTLIPAPEIENAGDELDLEYYPDFFDDFTALTEQYFYAGNPDEKLSIREQLSNCVGKKIHGELDKVHELQGIDLFALEGLSKAKQKRIKDRRAELIHNISLWESYRNIFTGETVGFFDPKYMFPDATDGFDVVIANPPYVSIEKFAKTSQQTFWKKTYQVFASRGDLYCLFYERGLGLLSDAGILSYISSNKFQRAGYGKGLRALISSQQVRVLIDFCELQVFEAGADPMIVILSRTPSSKSKTFPVLVVKDEAEFHCLAELISSRATQYIPKNLSLDGWSLQGGSALALIEKMRDGGTTLSEFSDLEIMAGIKTGFNKAFWMDVGEASRFQTDDPKCHSRFIKPLLVGDEARRWVCKPVSRYIAYTPRGTDQSDLGCLKDHLFPWKERLEKRALDQKWYELQQAQFRYSETWVSEKIVYPDIALEPRFSIDVSGRFPDMTAFCIPSASRSLLGILNSRAVWYFLTRTAAVLGDADNRGRIRCKRQYISKIPIPSATPDQQSEIEERVEKILAQKKKNPEADVSALEAEIDQLVYKLYDLTPEEIAIVEGQK